MDKELEGWHKLHKFYFRSGSYETRDLANYLKVSSRTIQRWVKEKNRPTREQLLEIKRYLNSKNSP